MEGHNTPIDVYIRKVRRSTTDNSTQWAFIPRKAIYKSRPWLREPGGRHQNTQPMHASLPEGICIDTIWGRYWAPYATAKYSPEALRRISEW